MSDSERKLMDAVPIPDDLCCPVCLDWFQGAWRTKCGHVFCCKCIFPLKTCPLCRATVCKKETKAADDVRAAVNKALEAYDIVVDFHVLSTSFTRVRLRLPASATTGQFLDKATNVTGQVTGCRDSLKASVVSVASGRAVADVDVPSFPARYFRATDLSGTFLQEGEKALGRQRLCVFPTEAKQTAPLCFISVLASPSDEKKHHFFPFPMLIQTQQGVTNEDAAGAVQKLLGVPGSMVSVCIEDGRISATVPSHLYIPCTAMKSRRDWASAYRVADDDIPRVLKALEAMRREDILYM